MRRFLLILAFAGGAFAAGSVQTSTERLGSTNNWAVTFYWHGDASTGAVPTTAANLNPCTGGCQGYLVTQVETVPGSTAPVAGYGVAITDGQGMDYLAGAAASLSASAAQSWAAPSSAPPIYGSFNLVISGQSTASATGTVIVFIQAPTSASNRSTGGGGGGGGGTCTGCVTGSGSASYIPSWVGGTTLAASNARDTGSVFEFSEPIAIQPTAGCDPTIFGSSVFASLPTAISATPACDGSIIFCSDCKNKVDNSVVVGTVASSSGAGAILGYANGSWRTMI